MRKYKSGLRTFGLLLVVALGLMAYTAVAAQATVKIGGEVFEGEETLAISAQVTTKITVSKLGLTIACSGLEAHEGQILLGDNTNDYKHHLFGGCSVALAGEESPSCKPLLFEGNISSHLLLFEGSTYLVFEAMKNEKEETLPYATIKFSEECALPETVIKGSLVYECLNEKQEAGKNLCETEMITHYIRPAPEKLFPEHTLTFGENPMTVSGVSAIKLSGINKGKKWSEGI